MNRNRKLRKQMMSGLAVGMAAVMGAAPVYAATGEDAAVSKEETVYVNANADGSEDQITVSNWLKNAGTEKNLQDESELKDIKNVKGDEEFTQSGNKLTWQTDGEDIYYQGTTTKEPPVSVKFTYYLDGKEIKPDDLAGKSGKLKIKVDYTNNTKTTVDINGKKETMYTPFVLMTGMILPQDTFSNVKIDNGDWIDLRAAEDVHLKKGEFRLISLGVGMKLPDGYEAHIAPRSSTYKNFKIMQCNSIGIVDNSYSGPQDCWKYPAIAMEDTVIHKNDRICQFRIMKKQPEIRFETVKELEGKSRGGFGSTGKN